MMSSLEVVETIKRTLSDILAADDHQYAWENPRRFSGYAKRLQLLVNQLLRLSAPEDIPASVQTALKGISGDLIKVSETLAVYKYKSKIFVLIKCRELCASLLERTLAIGAWLALLHTALEDDGMSDLPNKIADLSRDMKQAHFKVTENEERIYCTLQKEGQGRPSSKAVQSAIVMDLARALGVDSSNNTALSEQVKLLKNDIGISTSVLERRILTSLERIVDGWLIEPDILTQKLDFDFDEEGTQIAPFKNFLCPLTKEVMKDPVVLESSQTYERTAIQYWFERCMDDGREPTCPVTGMVLKSLELKPNIGLAGAIEEWVSRTIELQIKRAVDCLTEDSPPLDSVERVLDNIYKISEEHPVSRYKVRNAGVVVLILKVLKNSSKTTRSLLRSKALMALLSMAKDDESKKIMLEEGVTRLAIHGLMGSSENEKEFAVRLLLDLSNDEAYCIKIASEKGALVFLSSMADNLENPSLSHLAEDVLKQIERVDYNIEHLAAAGRFDPLLNRLCEGPIDVKVEMASIVGRMTLTNASREQIACRGAKVLVELLSEPEGRAASLQALYNLSCLDDNATILVDSAALPALTDILFKNQVASLELKALAASIIGNIVTNPGYWELASADKEGHSLQSESFVFKLLGVLSFASAQLQLTILRILYGIASSPQAADSVTTHIKSGDGIKMMITFLEHPEVEHRILSFRLTRVLSERLGEELASEIRVSNKLAFLKDKILDNQSKDTERFDAACILANLTLSKDEVRTILEADFIKWAVATLGNQHSSSNGRISQLKSGMEEGLLGILLHFIKNVGPQSHLIIKENCLMSILHDQLALTSKARVKQLATQCLKCLSEAGTAIIAAGDSNRQPPQGFCSSLFFMCHRASPEPSLCPIHMAPCEYESQLCLLKCDCIKPLVAALAERDASIRIAAVEALSTLLRDTSHISKQASDEFERLGMVESVILLFIEARPGELQDKAIWMVERILRMDYFAHRYSLNQSLVTALVEAFKHGSAITKRHAQDALTNLKQISGVSAKPSSHNLEGR